MRRALGLIVVVIALGALYQLLLGDTKTAGSLVGSRPVATIGSGADAVGVAADGTILHGLSLPEDTSMPELPLSTPPGKDRLAGPLLEQTRVLGAVPGALRPYVAGSYYGESGVDVELRSGIELRFGSASQAARKWRAAATVLADPSVSALDYVDLRVPGRVAVGGSGHALPPIP